MADQGNIGYAIGRVTTVAPKGLVTTDDVFRGPWLIPWADQAAATYNAAFQGFAGPPTKASASGQQFVASVSGYVLTNGVQTPNVNVFLLKYGPYMAITSWLVSQTLSLLPPWLQETVRKAVTDANGRFVIPDVRKGVDYTLLAYNPDSATIYARAVGMYLPALEQEEVELDFAYQNPAASGMFFILA